LLSKFLKPLSFSRPRMPSRCYQELTG
jgi:hypothetical protein